MTHVLPPLPVWYQLVSRSQTLLYLSLVRSQLTFCSQIWRPHLKEDILSIIEKIQRRATKFILNDVSSDYRTRFSLGLFPLMFLYELFDVLFFINVLSFLTQALW